MLDPLLSHLALSRTGRLSRGGEMRFPALAPAFLHELHCAADGLGAALAFALGAGCRDRGPVFLVRGPRRGALPLVPSAEGLAQMGLDPARLTVVDAGSEADLLRAGLDIARCRAVGAVLLESAGLLAAYDLTASRRLALAAERSGSRVVILRAGGEPRPTAAQTRWAVAAAPSAAWEAAGAPGAPGWPALDVELLRWRGGPAGRRWRLHWDGNHARFREASAPCHEDRAPLPGAVVPLVPVRARAA